MSIPDEKFIRLKGVPMTKEEVRVISLAKLRLFPAAVVYDIGAGTGSISVECGLMCPQGTVYAVEKSEEALRVLRENMQLFNVDNIDVIRGEAPGMMEGLPPADCIFIGGSGGKLEGILEKAFHKLKPGGRLVINTVTPQNSYLALNFLEAKDFKGIDITSINISKAEKKGSVRMWQAKNPVQIAAATKGGGV